MLGLLMHDHTVDLGITAFGLVNTRTPVKAIDVRKGIQSKFLPWHIRISPS